MFWFQVIAGVVVLVASVAIYRSIPNQHPQRIVRPALDARPSRGRK